MSTIASHQARWATLYNLVKFSCNTELGIRWALGYVDSRLAAKGSQEAGFTQPRAHLIAPSLYI